ncbi:T9SS type A sorting domain-containing protein [Runella sp. SP2]|uniref:T9SS type A sorting domain-containing protein n=1 Tax=Runella sp. SP2 TaxID=2268026 RepID=UPI000F075CFF|nr:T9SS type A sorting domain-containing protein [Runella sp. SP2]AYQ33216.1 T9SS C-terminal target domain-containing protein [Runella sp. SP2]
MKLHYLLTRLKHPKITYLTSFLLLLGLGLSQPLWAQKIWTGAAGTSDWNTASNWSPTGVPTATDDLIIPAVSSPRLYPTIITTDATAKSVVLNSNTFLTIANTGKLTLNGTGSGGKSIDNLGTIENNGQLVVRVRDESGLGATGLSNGGTIKNNAGAVIAVDNFPNGIIIDKTSASFINAGTINIGNSTNGLRVDIGSFDNMLGGIINIDNFSTTGINLSAGTFRNYATITIGATAGGSFGMRNTGATFINDGCSALLSLQSNSRIFSGSGATSSNSGTIIEKASGNSNITANTGLVQNLNGGTFDVGAGPLPALVAVGAAPTTFNGGDGSIKIKGLPNDTYELTYSKDGGSPTTNSVAVTTNEITIPSLGVGTYAITVKGTTCSTLEFSLSASVENPTLTLGTATEPTTCTGTGSIAFTSTGYGGTTQTLSYRYQANGSATAETRTASVSIANDGSFTLSNLPVGIYSQFAIGLIGATGSRLINVLADETTLVWTGCANGEWHNAANWSKLTVPTATDDVEISAVLSPPLYPTISTTDAEAKSVSIFSSATLTIANSGKLTINGFRNDRSFTNNVGGIFENNGQLVLGNESALGATGIVNFGTFNNNAGATISVDNTSSTAINNAANATFSNAGTVNVGQTQSVGASGIVCVGTFENKTGGVIKISRCTSAALSVDTGITFTNAGTINIGNVGIVLFGIFNLGNVDNNVGGEITVDNFPNGIGIENSASGVFRNYASIIVGGIAAGVNSRALNNVGTFSNIGCSSLLWIKSNSIITGTGTTNNAGVIIENATGTSTITTNTGLVQNLNGGTFTITQSATSVPVLAPLGVASSNCPTNNNGSVLLVGVEPNTEYIVTVGVGGTPQNLTSNASGQLSVGNLPIGTHTITFKKACWLQAVTITVEVSAASLTNGRSTRGATCTTAGLLVFDTNLGFTGTFSTYPATYKRNGVSQSGQMEVFNLGGGNTATISASEGYYTDIKVQYGTCEVAYAGATIYVAGAASPNTITPPTTCAGTNGSLLFTTSANVGTYSLSYKKNGNTVTTDVTVAGSRGRQFTLSNLSAGVYTDFAFTAGACNVTYSPIIRIGDLPNPAVSGTTAVTTVGGSDGSIQLSGLAVSKSYSISYQKDGGTAVTTTVSSDANGNLTIANLGGGSYTNIILTINGCSSSALSATVGAPAAAYTFAYSSTVPPSGCGAMDGALVFTTNLPVGTNAYTLEYTFLASPGSATVSVTAGSGGNNTFTLSGLRAGAYRDFKIVYNSTNITIADILTLSNPNKPTFAVGTKTPPSGCNTTDGSIQLTGLAASTSYSVSYQKDASTSVTATLSSDASGNLEISSLGAGAYTNIKVTLNNCVSDAATATLSAPTFTLTQTSSSNPTTCGATDGTLSFSTSLPMGNYTLSYKKGSDALSTPIMVGTSRGRVSAGGNTFVLTELGAGTYSDFKITYTGCEVTLAGPYTLNAPSLATASVAGSTTVCQNAASATITFTGANGTGIYTFGYRINGGPLQSVSSASGANTATLTQPTTTAGVFVYDLVSVSAANCSQAQTGNATVKVQGKPTITLTTLQRTLVEGNSQTLCDTDANPVNSLQFTVSGLCVVGNPVWRVQVGNGVWSDWSATAPVSQPSNNQPHRYQAACDAACPATYTGPIELTITGRASVPQNVSLLVDGVTVAVGETKEVCSLANTTLTFNANCAGGEVVLYSVDGGEYSAGVPTALVDNQFHNYRVRCRQSDGAPSCVESESGVMRLKLVVIPSAPTVSLSSTSSCNPSASFSGQSTCGSLRTVWYNASTNVALPSLPSTVPSQTTSYYARCQTENGCVSEKSNVVTFTLTPTQIAPVITASQEIVCTGTTVTISANCPAGSTTSWNTGVTTPSFEVAFSNVTKQTYWAKCLFEGGCQSAESVRKDIYWNAFVVTLINIGESKSAIKTNDRSAWTSQFITRDGGPELEQSTQVNPTLFYVENANKMAPRYWTIHADACGLGTNGSLTFDMQAVPEMGVIRSFNTHENNAPYFMYANREGWTELYAQNHPAYGFYQDNGAGGNSYDAGLPKGLYKLGIRYWDMKGWGSIFPSTRKPQGNVLAYQEYWFRIQSKDGIGVGAARTAESEEANGKGQGSDRRTAIIPPLGGRGLAVLPNPVTNILRLKVQENKGQVVQTSLTDASGREVLRRQFVPETNTHQEEFGVSELPAGMYFLKVTTADQQATLKVLKMN